MSAAFGVASPGDGDDPGDDAEEDVPPVLPASPVARIASGAVTLPGPGGEVTVAFFRGIFPSADHWLASSCFMLVETYATIVERLLQPVYNRSHPRPLGDQVRFVLPRSLRQSRACPLRLDPHARARVPRAPPTPSDAHRRSTARRQLFGFSHLKRGIETVARYTNEPPIPVIYIVTVAAVADLLKRVCALQPGLVENAAAADAQGRGSAKAQRRTRSHRNATT